MISKNTAKLWFFAEKKKHTVKNEGLILYLSTVAYLVGQHALDTLHFFEQKYISEILKINALER